MKRPVSITVLALDKSYFFIIVDACLFNGFLDLLSSHDVLLLLEVVGHADHDDPFFEKECALEH